MKQGSVTNWTRFIFVNIYNFQSNRLLLHRAPLRVPTSLPFTLQFTATYEPGVCGCEHLSNLTDNALPTFRTRVQDRNKGMNVCPADQQKMMKNKKQNQKTRQCQHRLTDEPTSVSKGNCIWYVALLSL